MKYLFFLALFLCNFAIEASLLKEETQNLDQLDVAIIGGGHVGLSVAFALQKQGIHNVAIFESAKKNCEGPWCTTARMKYLRSKKEGLNNLCFGDSTISFQEWYTTNYKDWDKLTNVSTPLWAEYLQWYRDVLQLPVQNEWHLEAIVPENNLLRLKFNNKREVLAKKIVLATGRSGCGGFTIPSFMNDVPRSLYFHTGEHIDPSIFEDKTVCIIGAGPSAFDAIFTALNNGSKKVQVIMRKELLPKKNLFSAFPYWKNFYALDDELRAQIFKSAIANGTPPLKEQVNDLDWCKTLDVFNSTQILSIVPKNSLIIKTNRGKIKTDLIILATGYKADITSVQELSNISHLILSWNDVLPEISDNLKGFPYLGKYFEFLEKTSGSAPFLKNIHCFNYGAFLSHGRIAGDIDQLPIGLDRLCQGIRDDLIHKNLQN